MIKSTVTIQDFAKLEMRVGKVLTATNKEGSEKLIRLVVDFGVKDRGNKGNKGEEREMRIIFTGVRGFGYTPEDFKGKQFFFITNLAPRKMMDEESQGMIMAASNAADAAGAVDGDPSPPADGSGQSKPLFLSADGMPVGAKIR